MGVGDKRASIPSGHCDCGVINCQTIDHLQGCSWSSKDGNKDVDRKSK